MWPGYDFLLRVAELLGKKWVIPLLSVLYLCGEINFSALKKQLKITSKTLSAKLRLLNAHGFIERVAAGNHIHYSLSARGEKVSKILFSLAQKQVEGLL
ncbi:helix-turn-helix transcriptional regulator [Candidatus Woesearchaeota archaeon]|nr:helix-turn-helix transcriptional regulator [Candidatus Woesearchaeota archaeon]